MEEYDYRGETIRIKQDENPESPREWDNLGKMICFHRRYNLGDKHTYDYSDYESWKELGNAIQKKENAVVMLPLGLYDHSGITMYIGNTHDMWDGGSVGWIVASREDILKEYSVKKISKKLLKQVTERLKAEVEIYDQYLTGDVWGYITDTDSCWEFYGRDEAKKAAEESIDYQIAENQKEHERKLKAQILHQVPLEYRMQTA